GTSRGTAISGPTAGAATFAGCILDEPAAGGEDVLLRASVTNLTGAPPLDPIQSEPIALQDATEAPLAALSLTRSSAAVIYGQSVSFAAGFAGGPNRPVDLQRSEDGAETWFSIAALTTDASGAATFSYRPRTTGQYRVVYEGPPPSAAGRSDEVTVIVKELATQSPVQSRPKVTKRGSRVTFT